jgi:triosephosphate isomerase
MPLKPALPDTVPPLPMLPHGPNRAARLGWLGAGWKMNKTVGEAAEYAASLRTYLARREPRVNIFIVPPFTALGAMRDILKGTSVLLAAQNMHWETRGAFTGEISPVMLKDLGVSIVELGHSERRANFGETDETVNRKVRAALAHGLRPLVCVGETAMEQAFGVAVESVSRQVKIALHGIPAADLRTLLLAYEPVWAIGDAGIAADPAYAERMHTAIRRAVADIYDQPAAKDVPILYGGSVTPENLPRFVTRPFLDGVFIGRAAWSVTSFLDCLEAFQEARQYAKAEAPS